MVFRAGIEAACTFLLQIVNHDGAGTAGSTRSHLDAQGLSELQKVIAAWPRLSRELRGGTLAMTRSAMGVQT